MERFVNEYMYTNEAIEEIMGCWWNWKFRRINILVAVCVVLFLVLFIVSRDPVYLITELAMVILIVFAKHKKNDVIKTEKKRKQIFNTGEECSFRVVVEDALTFTAATGDKTIALSNVVKIVEGKSFYVLILEGNILVPLKKNSFVEGDGERCIAYLREHMGKKEKK